MFILFLFHKKEWSFVQANTSTQFQNWEKETMKLVTDHIKYNLGLSSTEF